MDPSVRVVLRPGCVVDLAAGALVVDGHATALTDLEVAFLAHLGARVGQDVPTDALHQAVWGLAPGTPSRAAPRLVQRLREKLEPDPSRPTHLQTVPGLGFRLVVEAVAPPVAPRVLLGRDADRERVLDALERARVVTLAGIGGIGKTSLARTIAADRTGPFVELASARDLDGVLRALAAALGVPQSGDDPRQALGRAVAALGPALLVLDNAEQVVDEVRGLLQGWRAQAPDARWLVTSRVRVGLQGEWVVRLGPLDLPEPRACGEELRASPAVALFLARAEREAPLEEVAQLVRELEGIPLAIELAAARARGMEVSDILAQLDNQLLTLRREGEGRHDALWTTLMWSWRLLSEAEREVLAQCSVFRAPFRVEAAEAVLAVPGGAWPLDVLESLFDASLLGRTRGRDPRLFLYEVVREFASLHLQDRGTRTRHAAFFATWGAPELRARFPVDPRGLRDRRAAELDDLLFAAETALDAGDASAAVDLARAVLGARAASGPTLASLPLAERALALADTSDDPSLRARRASLRVLAASLLGRASRYADALAWVRRARADAQDPDVLTEVDWYEAICLASLGDPAGGEALARRALERAQALGLEGLHVLLLLLVGRAAVAKGGYDEAEALTTRALELGGAVTAAEAWRMLGYVRQRRGDLDGALEAKRRALDEATALDDRFGVADAAESLGVILAMRGDEVGAEAAFRASDEAYTRLGLVAPRVRLNLGLIAGDLGDLDRSRALLLEAEHLARGGGHGPLAAHASAQVGSLAGERGDLDEAEWRLRAAVEPLATQPTLHAWARAVLAEILARGGRVDEAAAELAVAEAALARTPDDRVSGRAACSAVHLGVARRDRDEAGRGLAKAEALLGSSPHGGDRRHVARARAALVDLVGDPA